VLDYIPWRVVGVWFFPVGVADSYWWSWVQACRMYVGCFHLIWVQYVAQSFSASSTVSALSETKERKRERKKRGKGKWLFPRQMHGWLWQFCAGSSPAKCSYHESDMLFEIMELRISASFSDLPFWIP
jgi:hypothetical protein